MPYRLSAARQGDYLHVSVQGTNDPETVLQYLAEVRETCLRERCDKVLIEENLSGPGIGTFQVFDVVTRAARSAFPSVLQIAYVDANPTHDSERMKFAETVAANRGVNVKVFRDLAEAAAWLSAGAERTV